MKKFILSFAIISLSNIHAVIVTDYPDPLTNPNDPNYRPRTSYTPSNNPGYINRNYNNQTYNNPYYNNNSNQYYNNPYPYSGDGVESRVEAANRHFDQQRETLLQSDPDRSGQQRHLDQRVMKQNDALRDRVLKQEEALNR